MTEPTGCVEYGGGLVVCYGGPKQEYCRERVEPRWCFGCRKRLGGWEILTGDVGMTYYEPNWHYECDGCGQDRRLGFGMSWEYA